MTLIFYKLCLNASSGNEQDMEKTTLRTGFTTGACAAVAAKAAMQLLTTGIVSDNVEISFPDRSKREFSVYQSCLIRENTIEMARASIIKDSGDDPDVTNGAEIIAKINLIDTLDQVLIKGGKGVGIVTAPGLQVPIGKHAINPVPMKMIEESVREMLPSGGVMIEVSVPNGEDLAKRTYNDRLGIKGGISILGTTGIVYPMSKEALKATIRCEINVAIAEMSLKGGEKGRIYISPGKIGEEALKRVFGKIRVIQMSNFIGYTLEYLRTKGVSDVVIGGHPGKLAKILMGYTDTHSANSPQATDFVSQFLNTGKRFNTVEEIIQFADVNAHSLRRGFSVLAEEIGKELKNSYGFKSVSILLFNMKKELAGRTVG